MKAGPHKERQWAAWPVRIGENVGALVAGGLDSDACALFEEAAELLSRDWTAATTEVGSGHPSHGWLNPEDYLGHLQAVVERNRDVGERFDLHRLRFNGPLACVDLFCRGLPEHLRAADVICRPSPQRIILLCSGPIGSFAFVRRRLMVAWERAWEQAGPGSPPPPIVDDRVEMVDPHDADGFLAVARRWLNER